MKPGHRVNSESGDKNNAGAGGCEIEAPTVGQAFASDGLNYILNFYGNWAILETLYWFTHLLIH